MKRYDLESCDGYAESCNAKMLEYKTGGYVLYDEVQPQLSILAKAVLEAHVCSNCPEQEYKNCTGFDLPHNASCCQCKVCTLAREVLK